MPVSAVELALQDALDKRKLVRVARRRIEVHDFNGYVIGLGERWVLLQPVRDRIDLDGYEALRLADISTVELSPKTAFYEAVLRKRRQRPVRVRVDLDTTEGLLASFSRKRKWGLIAIHRERQAPDVCEIGEVVTADKRSYVLKPVSPTGVFEEPEAYSTSEVTRVQFGNGYERALSFVSRESDQRLS